MNLQVITTADLAREYLANKDYMAALALTEEQKQSFAVAIVCDECGANVPTALRWQEISMMDGQSIMHDVCAACLRRFADEMEKKVAG